MDAVVGMIELVPLALTVPTLKVFAGYSSEASLYPGGPQPLP